MTLMYDLLLENEPCARRAAETLVGLIVLPRATRVALGKGRDLEDADAQDVFAG